MPAGRSLPSRLGRAEADGEGWSCELWATVLYSHYFPTYPMAKAITDAEFDKEVLKSKIPVLVDFWAPWCGPCKSMLPVVEELSAEYEGKAVVVKVNVDENSATPGKYNVMSIPTFIVFKNGEPVSTFVGVKSKEDVKKALDAAL